MKIKDKKTEQAAQKQAHKERLKKAKSREAAPDFQLPPPTRQERQRILIVCEGANTEPDYFQHLRRHFRLTAAEVVTVGGVGETIRVVERAKKERQKSNFDQIWVVFDKDDFPTDHFNNAVSMAEGAGFGVAYSNQAFEYWLILHFEDHQGGAMHRDRYPDKINTHLKDFGVKFDAYGSKKIAAEFFQILMGNDTSTGKPRWELAVNRAKRIFNNHKPLSPSDQESSTTIFKLVEELLKYS